VTGLAARVETQPAQVESVYNVRLGAVLAATLSPGATTISVDDTDRFVDGGGQLALESADDVFVPADGTAGTDAYFDRPSSIGVVYDSVDRVANTLHLAVAWDTTFPTFAVGDSVWVDPPAMDRRADVLLDGDGEQLVTARIPFALAAQLPEGVREPNAGEWCRVRIDDTGFEVVDVVNEQALIAADAVEVGEDEDADAAFDTITVDEVISPSVPRRSGDDVLFYVDPVLGSDENGGDAVYPLVDGFDRSVASGWGTADVGGTWGQAQYQGTGVPDVGVLTASAARLRVNGGSQTNVMVTNDFAALNAEVRAQVSGLTALPSAGSVYLGVGRIADSANLYTVNLNIATTGALSLTANRELAGTFTTLATVALPTYTAGHVYTLRVQIAANEDGGTTIRAKAWLSSGGTEPEAWQIETTDGAGGAIAAVSRWGCHQQSGSAFSGTSHGTWYDFAVTAIDASGEVVDTDAGGVGPLATLRAALDHLGSWNDGDVRISLIGDVEEDLEIDGLAGGGRLTVDGGLVAVLYGRVRLYGVSQFVEIRDLTLQHVAETSVAGVEMRTSRHIELNNLKMQGNGVSANGVLATEGSEGQVVGCQMNGYTTNAVQCIEGSTLFLQNNLGAGGATSSYRAAQSILFVDGTKPTVATMTANGGQIFGTTTNAAGTPPPTTNRKTSTHTANATKTWRPEWGWKSGDDAIQGEWAGSGGLSRGVAAYGTNLRKPGRTARSAKIYVRRAGSGGPGGKQAIYLAVHPEEKVGGGTPGITAGPTKIGELANGEGKWMDVPKSYAQSVMTGGGRGFMLYHGSPSPYVICAGRSGSNQNFQVKITHE